MDALVRNRPASVVDWIWVVVLLYRKLEDLEVDGDLLILLLFVNFEGLIVVLTLRPAEQNDLIGHARSHG